MSQECELIYIQIGARRCGRYGLYGMEIGGGKPSESCAKQASI